MSEPREIEAHTVALLLHYISPPSELQPLPKHLLSRHLLQRHEFLGVYPTDPEQYLCSSQGDRAAVIDALERLSKPVEDTPGPYPAQYAADSEEAFAYVRIPHSDLRITFLWDAEDGWVYHDAQLGSFPPASFPSLAQALRKSVEPESHHAVNVPAFLLSQPNGPDTPSDSGDDGSYWDAYGTHSDDERGRISRDGHQEAHGSSEAAEDAYWASYSGVQGTADSTIPSPVPPHRRQPNLNPDGTVHDPNSQVAGGHVLISRSVLPPRAYVEGEPPSPHTLSNLLSEIPRRPSSELSSDPPSGASTPPTAPTNPETGIATYYERADGDYDFGVGAVPPKINGVNGIKAPISNGVTDAADVALQQSIGGLYRLWMANRPQDILGLDDRDVFMQKVREVIQDI